MTNGKQALPENFPEGLKPRLRLFLSADLVGSTPFKQSRLAWRSEILSFYRNFDYILFRRYREFSRTLEGALPAPEFWKSNGDELLYTWELQNLAHAHAIMHIWLATMEEYRALSSGTAKPLDVKSTAWIGLFPLPNSEIFFRRGTAQLPADDVDDPVLLQSEMRDDWYANGPSQDLTKEYVGPSIDTGFRLTAWASPRRLIVSVDLAFLLTSLFATDLEPLILHLSGKETLKGVIDNEPYPTIWIPVGGDAPGPTGRNADRFTTDASVIRSHCEAIIEQHYKFITPIFFSVASHDDFGWAPPYILNQIVSYWHEETQYREQARAVA